MLNFLEYSKIDTLGKLGVSLNSLNVNNVRRDELVALYKDYGINYFHDGLEAKFKINISSSTTGVYAAVGTFVLSNEIGGINYPNYPTITDKIILLNYQFNGFSYLRIDTFLDEIETNTTPLELTMNVDYYCTFKYDTVNNQLYLFVYTDSLRTTLHGSSSCVLTAKKYFRYHSILMSDTHYDIDGWYGTISDYQLIKYENFLTHNTVNTDNKLTVTENSILVNNQLESDPSRVYNKFENRHFNKDWKLEWEYKWTDAAFLGDGTFTILTDSEGTGFTDFYLEAKNYLMFYHILQPSSNDYRFCIIERYNAQGPESYSFTTNSLVQNNWYYITAIKRGLDVSVFLYTDPERTILFESITTTLHIDVPYRNLYTYTGYGPSGGVGKSCEIRNFNITTHNYENFLRYIEVDPTNAVTIKENVITADALLGTSDMRITKNYGVDYFNENFIIDFYINPTFVIGGNNNYTMFHPIVLTNTDKTVGDMYHTLPEDWLAIQIEDIGSGWRSFLIESWDNYTPVPLSGLPYGVNTYIRLIRDESIGTNGTFSAYFFSDVERTVSLGSLSLTLNAKKDFKYLGIHGMKYNIYEGTTSGTLCGNLEIVYPQQIKKQHPFPTFRSIR